LIDEGVRARDAGFAAKARGRVDALPVRSSIMVIASHDEGWLNSFCNKAMPSEGGHLLYAGPTQEVLEAYHRHLGQ
jgi:ABC-2 type transport system ATP-binding protein/lipopolysaccharide transport system ATP-binding protein